MAFEIVLQLNNSENEKVIKELTEIMTLTGTLKAETSLIDPVVIIEEDLETLSGVNYITIPAFNRSYFVRNVRSMRSGLVEFSCHVDVLSSFASAIKSNTAIIKRQENLWNLYLNDGSFKVYQNPNVLTMPFPSGFTTQEFVLAIAGS